MDQQGSNPSGGCKEEFTLPFQLSEATFLGQWPLPASSKSAAQRLQSLADSASVTMSPLFLASYKDPCDTLGPPG